MFNFDISVVHHTCTNSLYSIYLQGLTRFPGAYLLEQHACLEAAVFLQSFEDLVLFLPFFRTENFLKEPCCLQINSAHCLTSPYKSLEANIECI